MWVFHTWAWEISPISSATMTGESHSTCLLVGELPRFLLPAHLWEAQVVSRAWGLHSHCPGCLSTFSCLCLNTCQSLCLERSFQFLRGPFLTASGSHFPCPFSRSCLWSFRHSSSSFVITHLSLFGHLFSLSFSRTYILREKGALTG